MTDRQYDLSQVSEEDRAWIEELILQDITHEKYSRSEKSLHFFNKRAYPWQREVANASNGHRIISAISGNRVGKTYTICAIVAMHLTGNYPRWYTGKKFDKPIKAYFAGVDSAHNRGVPQQYLLGTSNRNATAEIGTGLVARDLLIPETFILERKGAIEGFGVRHKSGGISTFNFKSYSQGADATQGFDAHLVVVDEQPPDEFFSELVKRTMVTDQGSGLVYCGFTPLKGITPLIEKFWELPPDPSKEVRFKSGKMIAVDEKHKPEFKGLERWATINATWDDVPHLSQEEMDETLAATPRYLWDAVKDGVPVAGKGRVYPHDQSKITYHSSSISLQDNWKWLIGIDIGFGERDPAAGVMIVWNEKDDVLYVADEFKKNVFTEQEFAREIWGLDPHIPVAWPDDAGRKGFKGQGTVQSLLSEQGVEMLPDFFRNPPDMRKKSFKALEPGFAHINSRLYGRKLFISDKCVMLLKEMSNYQYKESEGGGTDTLGEHHLCDAMRYAIMTIIQGYGSNRGTNRNNYWDEDIWEDYHQPTY